MDYVGRMKDLETDALRARGLENKSFHVLSQYQHECINRYTEAYLVERELYLLHHPEVTAMMKIAISKVIQAKLSPETELLKLNFVAEQLTRPAAELEKEIREYLNLKPNEPYFKAPANFEYIDKTLLGDFTAIHAKFNPIIGPVPESISGSLSLPTTKSSSFISIATSQSTRSTPEATPMLSPTTSEVFYSLILKIVDKATLLHVEPHDVLYDTAYVEVMKAVENAMELTVVDVKADIVSQLETAYELFIMIIMERAKIVAERNWERRMRKKLKRTLRLEENFKGYITPPTPKSELSSHESYKRPPPPPCKCHLQYHYNRYPKDRFGIYLPREEQFPNETVSSTPLMP